MLDNFEDLSRLIKDLKIPIQPSLKNDTIIKIDKFIEEKYKIRVLIAKSFDDPNRFQYLVSDDNIDSLVSEDFNDYETPELARLIGTIEGLAYIHLFLAKNALIKRSNSY